MGTLRQAFVSILALSIVCGANFAQAQQSRREVLAEELNRITNQEAQAMEFVEQGIPALMGRFKTVNPQIPETAWKVFTETMVDEFRRELPSFGRTIMKFWNDNFTEDELQNLVDFYKTPTGQKLAQKRPALAAASRSAGQVWGQEVGRRAGEKAEEKLRAMGYQLKL